MAGVFVLANIKGGTGKSTTSENLAVCAAHEGYKVAIIDADPARDISRWAQKRADGNISPIVHCEPATGDDVLSAITELEESYEIIIVDVGGADSEAMRFAMAKAHKVYIPIEPQEKSISNLVPMNNMVKNARCLNPDLKAYVFANRSSTNVKVTDTEIALEIAKDAPELEISGAVVCERGIIKKASESGLGTIEHPKINRTSSNVSAKREYKNLFKEVFSWKS